MDLNKNKDKLIINLMNNIINNNNKILNKLFYNEIKKKINYEILKKKIYFFFNINIKGDSMVKLFINYFLICYKDDNNNIISYNLSYDEFVSYLSKNKRYKLYNFDINTDIEKIKLEILKDNFFNDIIIDDIIINNEIIENKKGILIVSKDNNNKYLAYYENNNE